MKQTSKAGDLLAEALQARKRRKGKPRGSPEALVPYRFQPGQSGNPSGRPIDHARNAVNRLAHTSPPRALCEQIGILPGCTWVEAIVFSLGKAAAAGDVSAAREVLANLGLRGTAADNLLAVNVQDREKLVGYRRFTAETRWVTPEDFEKLWALCRELNRPPQAQALRLEEDPGESDD